MMPRVTDRVARGLQWLKERGPLYGLDCTRINPASLAVEDPRFCPLAQASWSGRYSVVINRFMSQPWVEGLTLYDWIIAHGFDVAPYDPPGAYNRLSTAWREALAADAKQRQVAA